MKILNCYTGATIFEANEPSMYFLVKMADAHEISLRNSDLSNCNLRNSNLRYSDLSNSDLRYSDLSNSDLRYSDLRNCNLSNCDLRNCNLSNSDLRYSDLSNSNLSNCDLRNCNLSNCNLSNSDLSNCDLSNSNLSNSDLSGTGIFAAQILRWWFVFTPDEIFVGCMRNTRDWWLALTEEDCAAFDTGNTVKDCSDLYALRPMIVALSDAAVAQGWPVLADTGRSPEGSCGNPIV